MHSRAPGSGTRRQVAWTLFDHFKIGDADGRVLDHSDLLRAALKNDNAQAFDTKCNETIIDNEKATRRGSLGELVRVTHAA